MKQAFSDLKFGMFIHFNMATYAGAQWAKGYMDPSTFDPGETVDTDAWADAALSAGMTYAVLTTKHVGGFCLWDSRYTDYSVMHPDCPYQQDLVDQFVNSFTSRGLKVGLYYCWRHPGFDPSFKVLPPECDPGDHSSQQQIEFQKNQIKELIETFPQTFYVWNDGLDPDIMSQHDAQLFSQSLGPDVVCSSNWWDWSKKGTPFLDVAIKETRHFPEATTHLSETCWTLEDGWFWNSPTSTTSYDTIKAAQETAYSRNSNFLLNVGPDMTGKILPDSLNVLQKLGRST